jgi:cytochrome c oxidase assembly factor 6
MGLFSVFQSDEQRRADEVRTGARAPSRSERQKCWEARDLYFSCLDRNDIVDAVANDKQARRACGSDSAAFERDCATEWVSPFLSPTTLFSSLMIRWPTNAVLTMICLQVKYFKQWRVADHQKKQRLAELQKQGAVQMDVTSQFTDSQSSSKTPGASLSDIQDQLANAKKR